MDKQKLIELCKGSKVELKENDFSYYVCTDELEIKIDKKKIDFTLSEDDFEKNTTTHARCTLGNNSENLSYVLAAYNDKNYNNIMTDQELDSFLKKNCEILLSSWRPCRTISEAIQFLGVSFDLGDGKDCIIHSVNHAEFSCIDSQGLSVNFSFNQVFEYDNFIGVKEN